MSVNSLYDSRSRQDICGKLYVVPAYGSRGCMSLPTIAVRFCQGTLLCKCDSSGRMYQPVTALVLPRMFQELDDSALIFTQPCRPTHTISVTGSVQPVRRCSMCYA